MLAGAQGKNRIGRRGRDWREPLRRFAADEKAATAIEYALIAAGLSIVIVGVTLTLGAVLRDDLYGRVSAALGAG